MISPKESFYQLDKYFSEIGYNLPYLLKTKNNQDICQLNAHFFNHLLDKNIKNSEKYKKEEEKIVSIDFLRSHFYCDCNYQSMPVPMDCYYGSEHFGYYDFFKKIFEYFDEEDHLEVLQIISPKFFGNNASLIHYIIETINDEKIVYNYSEWDKFVFNITSNLLNNIVRCLILLAGMIAVKLDEKWNPTVFYLSYGIFVIFGVFGVMVDKIFFYFLLKKIENRNTFNCYYVFYKLFQYIEKYDGKDHDKVYIMISGTTHIEVAMDPIPGFDIIYIGQWTNNKKDKRMIKSYNNSGYFFWQFFGKNFFFSNGCLTNNISVVTLEDPEFHLFNFQYSNKADITRLAIIAGYEEVFNCVVTDRLVVLDKFNNTLSKHNQNKFQSVFSYYMRETNNIQVFSISKRYNACIRHFRKTFERYYGLKDKILTGEQFFQIPSDTSMTEKLKYEFVDEIEKETVIKTEKVFETVEKKSFDSNAFNLHCFKKFGPLYPHVPRNQKKWLSGGYMNYSLMKLDPDFEQAIHAERVAFGDTITKTTVVPKYIQVPYEIEKVVKKKIVTSTYCYKKPKYLEINYNMNKFRGFDCDILKNKLLKFKKRNEINQLFKSIRAKGFFNKKIKNQVFEQIRANNIKTKEGLKKLIIKHFPKYIDKFLKLCDKLRFKYQETDGIEYSEKEREFIFKKSFFELLNVMKPIAPAEFHKHLSYTINTGRLARRKLRVRPLDLLMDNFNL